MIKGIADTLIVHNLQRRYHMLTARQNMAEVIRGGTPDRYVNQYEAIQLLFHPFMMRSPLLKPGDMNVVNAWGVTNSFPFGTP